jgi:hypothetical protein
LEPILIGLTGRARSGKDTIADYLRDNYNVARLAFADNLKKAAEVIFGPELSPYLSAEAKENPTGTWGDSPRAILQDLGQWVREKYGPTAWHRSLLLSHGGLIKRRDVVITDCRYDDEAQFVKERKGFVWQIVRPDAPAVRPHCSENGISPRLVDYVIENGGTILDLYAKVDAAFLGIIRLKKMQPEPAHN